MPRRRLPGLLPRLFGASEVHADPRTDCSCNFGNAVQPILLRPPPHHDQVAGPRAKTNRRSSAPRLDQKRSGAAERQHRNDAVRTAARKVVAMPPRAVATVSIQVQPDAVVSPAVVNREDLGRLQKFRMRHALEIPILRGQPRFEKPLAEDLTMVLSPGNAGREPVEEVLGSRHPPGHHFDPGGPIQRSAHRPVEVSTDRELAGVLEQARLRVDSHRGCAAFQCARSSSLNSFHRSSGKKIRAPVNSTRRVVPGIVSASQRDHFTSK